MDEVEKYQQRLQAIAEKRRLQEEEERAKRQLEDEKLRLQQLKRKSLRDQWLMEGAPFSPNSAGPQSPLWGIQPQQTEAHIDKLQTEIIDRTHKHKEDDSTSAQSYADHHGNERVNAVIPQSGSSVNGQEKNSDASPDTSLTNGTAPHPESHNTPIQDVNGISKGVETLLFLGYMEAKPGQGLCDEDDDDDDDVSAVIHAERVIITEEGEEVTQDMPAKEEEVEEREEGGEGKEEEREKGQEEEEVGGEGKEEEREKGQEEEEVGGEGKEEEREKGQEEEDVEEKEKGGERKEEEREKEQEEEKEEEEEEREKEIEGEGEKEQAEGRETDCKEESAADVENHPEMWDEADEITELEESLRNNNTDVDSLNQDTKVKTTPHTDEETSADAGTHLVRDSATNSASGIDLISDTSLAAVPELETPGGAIQTPFSPKTLPASTLNPNGAQKSPNQASTTTIHAAAQFQDIPLGGATVEEEPLLATKVEPLSDATNRNQAEGAKTKTCQCCTIM